MKIICVVCARGTGSEEQDVREIRFVQPRKVG